MGGFNARQRELGKPVGSDIREGKKTLFYAHLLRLAPAEELERLQGIFGRPEIRSGEIGYVRELAERLGVRAAVQRQVAEQASIGRRLIEALPEGYEAQIRPRSGLALRHAITLPNSPATIDPGYRGEIKIILLNLGRQDYCVRRGDSSRARLYTPPGAPLNTGS